MKRITKYQRHYKPGEKDSNAPYFTEEIEKNFIQISATKSRKTTYLGFEDGILTKVDVDIKSTNKYFPLSVPFTVKATVERLGPNLKEESKIENILLKEGFEPIEE